MEVGEIIGLAVGALAIATAFARLVRSQLRIVIKQEVDPRFEGLHNCVEKGLAGVKAEITVTNGRVQRIEGWIEGQAQSTRRRRGLGT